MPSGLAALLDDVAAIAKLAAASIDDVSAAAGRAGVKAAGVVIDDTAVTPRYVTGFTPERELPIIGRIALGSLKNKLIFLLPGALLLSWLVPWAITPILMLGGAYLCFEGAEKALEAFAGHEAGADQPVPTTPEEVAAFEQEKIGGAIRTDLILSAEIMAIALAELTTAKGGSDGAAEVATRVAISSANIFPLTASLAIVALAVTAGVYGLVAAIVKMDDAGLKLAERPATAALGRGLVKAMPVVLKVLGTVGIAAMIWVGGGIIVHGLHDYGVHLTPHFIEAIGGGEGIAHWAADAAWSGVLGFALGAALAWIVHKVRPAKH